MCGFRNRAARPETASSEPVRLRGELDGRKVVARSVGVVARVPRYFKLGRRLMQDPAVSGKAHVRVAAGRTGAPASVAAGAGRS
jgi:hypothetical protein